MSKVEPLEDWESKEVANSSFSEFGLTCFKIASKQTTTPRLMQWLRLGCEAENNRSMMIYANLLVALNPDLEHMSNEATLWLRRVGHEQMFKRVVGFDESGSPALRFFLRTLLSGSLSKNQDSVLYRSFFRSSMREVHLLPLISKYIAEEETIREETTTEKPGISRTVPSNQKVVLIASLVDICDALTRDGSSCKRLRVFLQYDNQFLCFLPLLFSHHSNLEELTIGGGLDHQPKIDLSLLQQVNTLKLEKLCLEYCSYDSLSPLSLCDLSSLRFLRLYRIPHDVDALNGLPSDITESLEKLEVSASHIEDLSPLSDCDLSSLEELLLYNNRSLSDLSALRGSDLSSLIVLSLDSTNISDLSPLCECEGLALEEFSLYNTPIKDLSPFPLLDLSRLEKPINLQLTNVSDLSPLEKISHFRVSFLVTNTPSSIKMSREGLKSPLVIRRVKVEWES